MGAITNRKLSAYNWIILVFSLSAIACFFLPWYKEIAMGFLVRTSDSGLSLALSGMTKTGMPLSLFFATLAAAAACLILASAYLIRRRKTAAVVPIVQGLLGLLGFLPFVLFFIAVRHAARRSSATTYWFSYFFWITLLAMLVIIVLSVFSYLEIRRRSASM